MLFVTATESVRADAFARLPQLHPGYHALPNVFITPHIGSATEETRDAMGRLLIEGIEALARGANPPNRLC